MSTPTLSSALRTIWQRLIALHAATLEGDCDLSDPGTDLLSTVPARLLRGTKQECPACRDMLLMWVVGATMGRYGTPYLHRLEEEAREQLQLEIDPGTFEESTTDVQAKRPDGQNQSR